MKNIIISILLAFLVLSSCTKEKETIIPRNKLSEILSELYLVDQYMNDKSLNMYTIDTLAIYEAIFNKHGYTYTDYNNSIAHYLYRSDKMVKIYKEARTILEKRRDEVQKEVNRLAERVVNWPTIDNVRGKSMKELENYPYLKSLKIIFEGIGLPEYDPSLEKFKNDSTSLFNYMFGSIERDLPDSLYFKVSTK